MLRGSGEIGLNRCSHMASGHINVMDTPHFECSLALLMWLQDPYNWFKPNAESEILTRKMSDSVLTYMELCFSHKLFHLDHQEP